MLNANQRKHAQHKVRGCFGGSAGVRVGSAGVCIGSVRTFGYQLVGISKTKRSPWLSVPLRALNASPFRFWWNIGFTLCTHILNFNNYN